MGKLEIQTLIFDLDGTIVDTEPVAAKALLNSFLDWGIQIQTKDTQYVAGKKWEIAFDYLQKKYKISNLPEDLKNNVFKKYKEYLTQDLKTVQGSINAIQELSQTYPLGLVSGSKRDEVFWILNQLGLESFFRVVLASEDYGQSKPSPEGYLKALDTLGATPYHTLVFEDSEAGIASAKKALLWVTAVTSTNHFNHDQSLADFYITDFLDVSRTWIQNLAV